MDTGPRAMASGSQGESSNERGKSRKNKGNRELKNLNQANIISPPNKRWTRSQNKACNKNGSLSEMDSRPQAVDSGSQENSSNRQDAKDTEYIQNLELYRAVDSGDLDSMDKFLKRHEKAATESISRDRDTALHIAVLAGRVKVVEALVNRLEEKDLQIKNNDNSTALNFAAMAGVRKIAALLVEKNAELLRIPNMNKHIPVVVAAIYGHNDMVRYLYSKTSSKELDPVEGNHGVSLFITCIIGDIYDIPLDLLGRYSQLACLEDEDKDTAIDMLAQKPSAFPSGTRLTFWQQWIYSCIYIHDPYAHNIKHGDIERPYEGPAEHKNFITGELNQLFNRVWKNLKFFVPAIQKIYELKLTHMQCQQLLSRICREISTKGEKEIRRAEKAVFQAVEHGIVEIVKEIIKYYPDILWCMDAEERSIFAYAVLQRQEKIFRLIYTIGPKKNSMLTKCDKSKSTILHQAAYLVYSQHDRVSGAALQMQRELQWFKEVESNLQPYYKELINADGKTPQDLFTDEHKTLVEKGEKWMKDTAQSCTVVAALIATIMFAAAFTVPGGYDDSTGIPHYLHRNSFMVFIVSDALSFFSSCTSVLMFLGILTSRYRENDFLISLPRKLIIGLSSLFFSIATMMVTFGVTLVIVLRERISWVSFPIVLFASFPVTLFALLQFPLLIEIFQSTYGPGIFKKPKKLVVEDLN